MRVRAHSNRRLSRHQLHTNASADARGGEGGPNLVRSGLVLNDIKGELIIPVVQNGRPDLGMPRFDLTLAQISDLAAFLHTFRAAGRDPARNAPPNVLVGDAKA